MDIKRRLFCKKAAMTLATIQLGVAGCAEANDAGPLDRATEWINSARLTAVALRGRVVVVHFGTYTCINWLRTVPYIRAWTAKYPDLVVIGVHTPEFPFEYNVQNVRRAMKRLNIGYPIAVDNNYAIWRGFDNQFWPALYVIDPMGHVRHHQFGEGAYDQAERTIQKLLGVNVPVAPVAGEGIETAADWENLKSSENYLGNNRTQHYASSAARLPLNAWTLTGEWRRGSGSIVSKAARAGIRNRFHARDLHLVMGPEHTDRSVRFRVTVDDEPPQEAHGLDIDAEGNGTLGSQRLHQLVRQPKPILDRVFEIEFLDADVGAEVFSFTFG
jgi:hypothetical protein